MANETKTAVEINTAKINIASGQRQLSKREQRKMNRNHEGSFQRMSASEIIFKILSYLLLTIFALICLYPFIYTISASIATYDEISSGTMVLFPIMGVQWDAFRAVFTNKTFWISYSNTLFITLYGTIYSMAMSIFAAFALSKTRMFGNKFFNFILVFTMWFSAGMIPTWLNYTKTWQIMSNMGFDDTKWLIVLAMGSSAFNIIVLRNAFQAVPKEIEEAAQVDGANDMQILTKVYVPMSKASVATVALFFGVSRWNGYFWARQMADPQLDIPLQVAIRLWLEDISSSDTLVTWSETYHWDSYTYSLVVVAIIPILIIYPFIQKYFAAGVNLGGVKE